MIADADGAASLPPAGRSAMMIAPMIGTSVITVICGNGLIDGTPR